MGQISIQKRNGAIVGYSVYLGVDSEGQKLRRFFKRLPDAEKFVNGRKTTPLPVGELLDTVKTVVGCEPQRTAVNVRGARGEIHGIGADVFHDYFSCRCRTRAR